MAVPAPTSDRERRLLAAVYELLVRDHEWPEFRSLDQLLDRRDEPDAEETLLNMTPGLIYGPGRGAALVQPNQQIALTVAGLAAVSAAKSDVDLFLSVVQFATELERTAAGDRDPVLSRDAVENALGPGHDAEAFARAGAILRAENWGWSGAHGGSTWSFQLGRRVRRFRDVTALNDYWERAHPDPDDGSQSQRVESRESATRGKRWSAASVAEKATVITGAVALMLTLLTFLFTFVLNDDSGDEGSTTPTTSQANGPAGPTVTAPSGPFIGPTFVGTVDGSATAPASAPVGIYPAPSLEFNSVYQAQNGETFEAVCQAQGQRIQDDQLRSSTIWTLVDTPNGYGFISEVHFGFHQFVLDECPLSSQP